MLTFTRKPKQQKITYTCANLPMAIFVQCLVNAKLDLVGGEQAWETISQEYSSLIDHEAASQYLTLLKSIAVLTYRIELIEILVNEMASRPIPDIAARLQKMGFRFPYTDNLERDLQATINQARTELLRLQQDQKELEDLRKTDGKAATEQDYEMQYSAIEQFKGVSIDPDTYMVARYAADIRRMKMAAQVNQN